MSAYPALAPPEVASGPPRIARVRAVVALVWAAAIGVAAGDAGMELSTGLAVLVAAYPVIDVVASLLEAGQGAEAIRRMRINAAVSALAVAGLAVAAFGSDVGSVLAVFGAWAIASGLIQLVNAMQRRRAGAHETPLLVSGGLSAIAGLWMIASSGADDPALAPLAGYAAVGAVLFLLSARGTRACAT